MLPCSLIRRHFVLINFSEIEVDRDSLILVEII